MTASVNGADNGLVPVLGIRLNYKVKGNSGRDGTDRVSWASYWAE
jgi:hypothetical protein